MGANAGLGGEGEGEGWGEVTPLELPQGETRVGLWGQKIGPLSINTGAAAAEGGRDGLGRAPFEVRGPLPIGRARPYQTRPCRLGRPRANNGLPRACFMLSRRSDLRAAAQPLHLRPPPNVCTSIKAAGRALRAPRRSRRWEEPGAGAAPARTSASGCRPPTTLPNSRAPALPAL